VFVLRRAFRTGGQGGAWIELNLIFVFALGLLVRSGFTADVLTLRLGGWIVLLAVISATSMLAYYAASRLLPFSLFGLLGYLEPVLLVVVGFVLGQSLDSSESLTYVPIWAAVLLLVLEGTRNLPALLARKPARASASA
jgi:chloramphenicol-sensitive protein RarD